MMVWENILSQEIVQKLGWTLLHFVWQATAVALLLAILLRVLRKTSANLRYIIACSALALVVLLPIVTIQLVAASAAQSAAHSAAYIEPVTAPPILPKEAANELSVAEKPMLEKPVRLERPATATWKQWSSDLLEPALPYIVFGWLIGVLGLSVWHLGGWAQLQRLRRKMVKQVDVSLNSKLKELADRLQVKRAIRLLESALVGVPTVVGWLRPVILLPASALTGLTTEQLEAMLAHELAHIKRFDYLVNMLQMVVEILGFYHPAVWWVSHKIRAERENCCDDLAVSISGDRVRYAKALTSMEEIRASRGELVVAVSGGSLFARVRRLVGTESGDSRDGWLPSAIAILLIVAMIIPTTIALTSGSTKEIVTEHQDKPTKSLHQAAADGDIEQVKLLISKGEDVNAKDRMGRTALHRAAEKGHTDVVKLLISHGADVNEKDEKGETALHRAIMGHKAVKGVTELLIAKGADVNAKGWGDATPLHYASFTSDMDTLALLIAKGANLNTKNGQGQTAVDFVVTSMRPRKHVVKFLLSKGASASSLQAIHLAAFLGDMDKVRSYVNKGNNVNARGGGDETPLHIAAIAGQKEVVEFLIDKGADVHARDVDGKTPLHYAVMPWGASNDVIEILLNKDAHINATTNKGMTPTDIASLWFQNRVVKLLLERGGNVSTIQYAARTGSLSQLERFIENGDDIGTKYGVYLLDHAAMRGHIDMDKFLIEKGTDVNGKRDDDWTPLHSAAYNGHEDVARVLIAAGADLNPRYRNGNTPLHTAAWYGHKNTLELLLTKGADLNLKNHRG